MTEEEISKQITRYINGKLNDEEEDQLWVEFLKDRQRFRQFETELNLYDLFQNKGYTLTDSDERVEEPKSTYMSWLYAAAAVVLLASGIYFYSNLNETGTEDLAVLEIELSELLGSDIYRDDRSTVADIDQNINRAISSALDGNYSEAYQILDGLDTESLSEMKILRIRFNQGVIAYNSGNYSLSVEKFSKLTASEQIPVYLKENALWYKANGYLKLQDNELAISALKQIISIDDQHVVKAREILTSIETTR